MHLTFKVKTLNYPVVKEQRIRVKRTKYNIHESKFSFTIYIYIYTQSVDQSMNVSASYAYTMFVTCLYHAYTMLIPAYIMLIVS